MHSTGFHTMMLEFLREGRTLSRAETPLPAPDPDGVTRNIVPFSTESFSTSTYEVKVALSQADSRCEDNGSFTIVP